MTHLVSGRRMLRMLAAIGGAWLVAAPAHAQGTTRRLTGRVTDAEGGAPIATATVLVNGTTLGTTAGDSGNFALNVPERCGHAYGAARRLHGGHRAGGRDAG